MEQCPRCKGIGKVNTASDDEVTGAKMRKLREGKGDSLRSVAAKIGKSPAYLSRLEHGRERWNPDLEKRFCEAIGEVAR